MPRRWFLVVAVALALALGGRVAEAEGFGDVAARAKRAVVHLRVMDGTGREIGTGSGFFITEGGRLMTNHHVIEDAARAVARLDGGREVEVAGVLGSDPVRDLAVLQVPGSGYPHLALGSAASIRPGDEIAVIGSPAGFAGSLSTGVVAAVRTEGLDGGADEVHSARAWTLQITAPISPGSSGSPILTKDGVVVGVAVGVVGYGQALNFGVSADAAQELAGSIAPGAEPKSLAELARAQVVRNLVISAIGIGGAAALAWLVARLLRKRPRRRSRVSDIVGS